MIEKLQLRAGFAPVFITFCLSFINCLLSPMCRADSFAGGTGEPNDPYRIATAEHLISIGSDPNLLSKHFVLIGDIDLDPGLPGGRAFTQAVIGPSRSLAFSGSFDGAGHVIHNLNIRSFSRAGLFGYVAASGVVKNLGAENASITGESAVGGLVVSNDGTIFCCHSTGSVAGWAGVGGLVGDNRGEVSSCNSTATVNGTDTSSSDVGGLVGYNSGTVSSCHSTGSVAGSRADVGGLVGSNQRFGNIICCYSTGSTIGKYAIGGLVGHNEGEVFSCYSTGGVTGSWKAGGLVGDNSGTVSSCYTTAGVTGSWDAGGLVGRNSSPMGGAFGQPSYFLAPSDGGGPNNGLGTALTSGQIRQQGSFVGFDFWGTKADGLRDNWFMPVDSPPVLAWQTEQTSLQAIPDLRGLTLEEARWVLEQAGLVLAAAVQSDYDRTMPQGHILRSYPPSYTTLGGNVEVVVCKGPYDWSGNPGDGTAVRPYEIQDANQLDSLVDHPVLWGMHFVLTADIDMVGRTYSQALIAPDANASTEDFQGTAFTGSFDGNGFKIMNLDIASLTNDYLGMFGFIAKGATVKRVDLVNVWITGESKSDYVGTVAGYNAGTVQDCSVTGAVSGHKDFVDELVGGNSGTVENCRSVVFVQGLS